MRCSIQRISRSAGLVALTGFAIACDSSTGPQDPPAGLARCQGTAFLNVAPIDPNLLREIVPLGNLNPPGHTLPTDHLYLNTNVVAGVSLVTNVVAPGDIILTEVSRQTRSGGGQPDAINYGMTFFACADVLMSFAHVVTLSADLAARVGTINRCDAPYSTGGFTSVECRKSVEIRLTAGTLIGTTGGPNFPGIDYGGVDRRVPDLLFVNQTRSHGSDQDFGQNHTICPIDYFVPSVADALRARLGQGSRRRTVAPVCGSIMQDVSTTAQGRWYFDNTQQDDPHLALVHDNVDPRLAVISSGTSIPSLPYGARQFTPAAAGRINLDFSRVTSDGLVYCYQSFSPLPPPPLRHILIQLTSTTRLRIEGVLGATCGDPSTWTFSPGARDFAR